jgi:predicted  nucleic acid-binding Zn-ribbon protein
MTKQLQQEKRKLSERLSALTAELMPLLAKVESLRSQIRTTENELNRARDSKFQNRETR